MQHMQKWSFVLGVTLPTSLILLYFHYICMLIQYKVKGDLFDQIFHEVQWTMWKAVLFFG